MQHHIIQICALLFPLALFCSCAPADRRDNATLVVALESMPIDLDPRFALDANSSRVDGLVFTSLTRPDAAGAYAPYTATGWEALDERTYRFSLRHDLRFHDGSPLTAADVVATYHAVMDPAVGSPRSAALSALAEVTALGRYSVLFRLGATDASFMEATTLAILPARLASAPRLAGTHLVGAGPYRIASVAHGRAVRLAAFDGFPGEPASIPAIEFRIVPDATMRALELRSGTIDLVQNDLDPDTVSWFARSSKEHEVRKTPASSFQYLGLNLTDPILADPRVRRAIAYGIDRPAIVRYVLENQARVATGMLPPEHWAYTPDVRTYPYDPERAQRLLEKAGLVRHGTDPRFTLEYKTSTQELSRRLAEVLAAQLAAIGIRLRISSYEWGTFFDDIRHGSFQLYSLRWVGITDPDLYRMVLHSRMRPPQGYNRGGFDCRRVDRLTEAARSVMNHSRRRALYRRVQRVAARRLPSIPLWWPDNVVVSTTRLRGFTPEASGDLLALSHATLGGRIGDTPPANRPDP